MAWLRRHANRLRTDSERKNGFVQRVDPAAPLARENDTTVVTTRDYLRKVTSRTMRNDVYRDALRAAESTLRDFARKK